MGRLRTLDNIASMLERTERFRVLRRVPGIDSYAMSPASDGERIGIVIDCEATGVEPHLSTPIEIAAIKFAYDHEGSFLHVVDTFESLNEPAEPLDPIVSALTGLTDMDLADQRLDRDCFEAFLADVQIVIAHGSRYDRALLETWIEGMPLKPWACSLVNIDWHAEHVFDRRLGDLLRLHDLYADGHRAMVDCASLLQVLIRPLPVSRRPSLSVLLASARRCSTVIFAEASPISTRTRLKRRGYRWSNGDDGAPRCWWIEVDASLVHDESEFLAQEIYPQGRFAATMTLVSALHRFRPLAAIAKVRTPLRARTAATGEERP